MSESEPALYGRPEEKQPRLTDAQLAQQWARKAANEDRLDLASALYRIAAQAKRAELPHPVVSFPRPGSVGTREYVRDVLGIEPFGIKAEDICSQLPACRDGEHSASCEVSLLRVEQVHERTRAVPLIGSTRAEEPRSHAPTSCAQCGAMIRWNAERWWHIGDSWKASNAMDDDHPAKPIG